MKRIEKLILDGEYECCMLDDMLAFKGVPIYSDGCEVAKWFLEELPEPRELTVLEHQLAIHALKDGYNWIARDEDYWIAFHVVKPDRDGGKWVNVGSEKSTFDSLYQFVKWSDEEPTNLQELINNCKVVDNMSF